MSFEFQDILRKKNNTSKKVYKTKNKLAYISIFERSDYSEESWHLDYDEKDAFTCVFVGLPTALIDKYKYTDKEDHKPNTNEEG